MNEKCFKIYIAGFLDGEGEIGIHKMNEEKGFRKIRHRLEVAITNCNQNILLLIQSKYGGNIHKKKQYTKNSNICYRWRIEGQHAIIFLKKIYPYLMIKRLQADIAFEFAKTLRTIGGDTRTPISNYMFKKRNNLYDKIKNMNLTKSYNLLKEVMPFARKEDNLQIN